MMKNQCVKFMFTVTLASLFLAACASNPPVDNDPTRAKARSAYNSADAEFATVDSSSKNKENQAVQTPSEAPVQQSAALFKVKPTIMVMPAIGSKGAPSIEVIRKNPLAKTAMEVINAYMTERGYNVSGFETQSQIDEAVQLQSDIAGNDEDLAYVAGLAVGADISLTFAGSIHEGTIVIDLNATDASTAKLIASESVSQPDNGEGQRVLVQNAVRNAIVKLESKVREQLAADQEKGVQYKVVCRLTGDFTDEQAEEISNLISSKIRKKFNKMQVNSMTRNTIDLLLFADPDVHEDSQMVYAEFYEALSGLAKVRRQNITKKLLVLEIQ